MHSTPAILKEKNIHEAFEITVILRGLGGVFDLILAFFILFPNSLSRFFLNFIDTEFALRGSNFFVLHAHHAVHSVQHGTMVFVLTYLLAQGVLKIFLVAGLLADRLWAYPLSITFFSVLILYQLKRILLMHSPLLMVVTCYDIFVTILIWHEYQHHKNRDRLKALRATHHAETKS